MNKWIPINKMHPIEDGIYLCCFDDDFIATVLYRDNDWELWADSGEVVAWMPLPKPYSRENDNKKRK